MLRELFLFVTVLDVLEAPSSTSTLATPSISNQNLEKLRVMLPQLMPALHLGVS